MARAGGFSSAKQNVKALKKALMHQKDEMYKLREEAGTLANPKACGKNYRCVERTAKRLHKLARKFNIVRQKLDNTWLMYEAERKTVMRTNEPPVWLQHKAQTLHRARIAGNVAICVWRAIRTVRSILKGKEEKREAKLAKKYIKAAGKGIQSVKNTSHVYDIQNCITFRNLAASDSIYKWESICHPPYSGMSMSELRQLRKGDLDKAEQDEADLMGFLHKQLGPCRTTYQVVMAGLNKAK